MMTFRERLSGVFDSILQYTLEISLSNSDKVKRESPETTDSVSAQRFALLESRSENALIGQAPRRAVSFHKHLKLHQVIHRPFRLDLATHESTSRTQSAVHDSHYRFSGSSNLEFGILCNPVIYGR